MKNLLAITLIAMGVPMIGMGDEVRRTQRGNNNPFCQDNEISWFDWSGLIKGPVLARSPMLKVVHDADASNENGAVGRRGRA